MAHFIKRINFAENSCKKPEVGILAEVVFILTGLNVKK